MTVQPKTPNTGKPENPTFRQVMMAPLMEDVMYWAWVGAMAGILLAAYISVTWLSIAFFFLAFYFIGIDVYEKRDR